MRTSDSLEALTLRSSVAARRRRAASGRGCAAVSARPAWVTAAERRIDGGAADDEEEDGAAGAPAAAAPAPVGSLAASSKAAYNILQPPDVHKSPSDDGDDPFPCAVSAQDLEAEFEAVKRLASEQDRQPIPDDRKQLALAMEAARDRRHMMGGRAPSKRLFLTEVKPRSTPPAVTFGPGRNLLYPHYAKELFIKAAASNAPASALTSAKSVETLWPLLGNHRANPQKATRR